MISENENMFDLYKKGSVIRMNRIKYKNKCKKTNKMFVIALFSIVILVCSFVSLIDNGDVERRNKYFSTIKVEEGDTLWSIAQVYYSYEYSDYTEYIEEVKDINNMKDENIKKGNYIIVPYYAD